MRKSTLLIVICALVFCGNVAKATAQDADIKNARVVEMTKLGLDDDIVIAKVKSGEVLFQLADSDPLDLKKAGVSPKVIAAMLDATVLTSARVLLLNSDKTILLLDKRPAIPPGKQKVGEYTVQLGAYYFSKVLDLEEHLLTEHYMKYNLRFY
jgi:hypothetical protein